MELQNSIIKGQIHNEKVKIDLTERCLRFSIQVLRCIEDLPPTRTGKSILDQITRSSTSIGANIAEAKSASSKRDFLRYYEIALKSANETKYWLALLRDGLNLGSEKTDMLMKEVHELANIIAASILTLKGRR